MINHQEISLNNNNNNNKDLNNNSSSHSNNILYNDGAQNIVKHPPLQQQQQNNNNNNNNNNNKLQTPIQIKEKYLLRKENNEFPTLLPNELMPFFTFTDYHQLITTINKYKSPSEKFYIVMMVFETLLFLVATGLGFYFLSTANNNKTSIAIGLFLLVLSVLTLIGCSITFFRKSKMTIDEIGDFYNKLNKRYENKHIRIVGVFKRNIYPKLGDQYYNIENNEIIFEYPKQYNSQGVFLHNLNSITAQYLTINSNDNNDNSNQKIPLLTPRSLLSTSSSINNDKL